jgi:hypothetical protein
VVYRAGRAARDGVRPAARSPGHPAEAAAGALFAVPYDMSDVATVRLVADDGLGNIATTSFVERFIPRAPKSDSIPLDDKFLAKVVPEIMSRTPELEDRGSPLANYLQINGELRRRNARTLVELAAQSPEEFLWRSLPTAPQRRGVSLRRSPHRTRTRWSIISHLGFDLAVVERAPVPAASRGRWC